MQTNGAGHSDSDTPTKLELFSHWITHHMQVVGAIYNKSAWATKKPYIYVDLNAGRGWYDDLRVYGSPLIFLKNIALRNWKWQSLLFEKNTDEYNQLRWHVDHHFRHKWPDCVGIYNEDNRMAPCRIISARWQFGIVYHDPNGKPDVDLLLRLAEMLPHTDILVNINSLAKKRNGESNGHLLEEIQAIKRWKERCIVSELYGRWQWSMMLFTNAPTETLRAWSNLGFHEFETAKAQSILVKASYTAEQIREMQQPTLFS